MSKTVEYTVEGRGAFPTDMLRYDCAWPARQEDVYRLDQPRNYDLRSVTLRSASKPTVARWASFGWAVKP